MRGILALEKPQSTASLDTGGHLQVHSMCAGAGIAVTLEEQSPALLPWIREGICKCTACAQELALL